ncbi:DNA-binding anti-repressor SinI [Aquibacillus halophilus]|uniref:DNA-binding anti-repressor SinI n=1 Tax=Aquibacillus halophilus TaxID=930132 RepID=A0A6A8D8N6_9BACI|nr:DNA-binding anti-repressor SinI [Aquibacillus halophilus]MRH41958.1 DNA-binding anti-repressor SinI [Aquibacillus halophilus]
MKLLYKRLLDRDWIEMMEEAKQLGLSIEEVKLFLLENKK